MNVSDFERGIGPVAVAVSATDDFCRLMYTLGFSFADPTPLELDFRALNSRSSIFNAEDAGTAGTLTELYMAGVMEFTKDALVDEASPHYRLASTRGLIEQYVTYFDIRPDGLDVLKYTLAFGLALSLYFKSDGERHVLSALARMRTLRVMRAAASTARSDQTAPAKVMVEKLQKIWKEEEHERLTGLFGTYMLFKTWSLPGEVGGVRERDQGEEQTERTRRNVEARSVGCKYLAPPPWNPVRSAVAVGRGEATTGPMRVLLG